jgi:parallel beta-helix repeat protein
MMKKQVASLVLLLILVIVIALNMHPSMNLVKAQITNYVIEPDGSVEPSNPLILTDDNVTYTFTSDIAGSLTVERSNIIIDGNGNTLQGANGVYNETAFTVVNEQNVTIQNMIVTDFYRGFYLNVTIDISINNNTIVYNHQDAIAVDQSINLTVNGNNVANNIGYGVRIERSTNNAVAQNMITNNTSYGVWINYTSQTTVSQNNITDNLWRCILLDSSSNNTIRANYLKGSEDGIFLYNSTENDIFDNTLVNNPYVAVFIQAYSHNNRIINNTLIDNDFYGFYLFYSKNNTLTGNNVTYSTFGVAISTSDNSSVTENTFKNNKNQAIRIDNSTQCKVIANTIVGNRQGIELAQRTLNNTFYHNNMINNTAQVIAQADDTNNWDNGFEGNYWSNYTGTDTDNDGIGDIPQTIDANSADHYPLAGEYNMYNGLVGNMAFSVDIISNSTINDFMVEKLVSPGHDVGETIISFDVMGEAEFGFCRLAIPKNLLSPSYNITIDNGQTPILNYNESVADSTTYRWIYVAYEYPNHHITITPEFPPTSVIIIFFFAMVTISVIFYKRDLHTSSY